MNPGEPVAPLLSLQSTCNAQRHRLDDKHSTLIALMVIVALMLLQFASMLPAWMANGLQSCACDTEASHALAARRHTYLPTQLQKLAHVLYLGGWLHPVTCSHYVMQHSPTQQHNQRNHTSLGRCHGQRVHNSSLRIIHRSASYFLGASIARAKGNCQQTHISQDQYRWQQQEQGSCIPASVCCPCCYVDGFASVPAPGARLPKPKPVEVSPLPPPASMSSRFRFFGTTAGAGAAGAAAPAATVAAANAALLLDPAAPAAAPNAPLLLAPAAGSMGFRSRRFLPLPTTPRSCTGPRERSGAAAGGAAAALVLAPPKAPLGPALLSCVGSCWKIWAAAERSICVTALFAAKLSCSSCSCKQWTKGCIVCTRHSRVPHALPHGKQTITSGSTKHGGKHPCNPQAG
jgi:hypothetical protein